MGLARLYEKNTLKRVWLKGVLIVVLPRFKVEKDIKHKIKACNVKMLDIKQLGSFKNLISEDKSSLLE